MSTSADINDDSSHRFAYFRGKYWKVTGWRNHSVPSFWDRLSVCWSLGNDYPWNETTRHDLRRWAMDEYVEQLEAAENLILLARQPTRGYVQISALEDSPA